MTRLGAGIPSTCDVSQVPSTRRAILPDDMPFEIKACAVPGGVASRIACRSPVIWRASISMKPEPNMPTVLRELAMLCSETGIPRSSKALFTGSVSFRLNVAKSKRWARTKTFPTISPPPPISGRLYSPRMNWYQARRCG